MKCDLYAKELTAFCKTARGLVIVYALRWDGKPYVGSTTNLWARIVDGWRGILKGKVVEFEVLEFTTPEAMYKLEQEHIYRLNSYAGGHNKTPGGKPGAKRGRPMTQENKTKLLALRTGYKFSPEAIASMTRKREGLIKTSEGQSNARQFAFGFPHSTTKEPHGNR